MAYRTWATGETITASLLNAQSPTLCTSGTRPTGGNLYEGVIITETDTDRVLYYDGTNWIILMEPTQTYTPTLTNLTLGNGTLTGTYHRSDGWCDFAVSVAFGSTTTMGTSPEIGLPVATTGLSINQLQVGILDLAPVTRYLGTHAAVGAAGTTTGVLYSLNSAGASLTAQDIQATLPMTWATGDVLYVAGRYRMNTRYL
jgi:hypothetical protein